MQFSLIWIIFLLCFYFTSARTNTKLQPNYPTQLTAANMKGLLRGLKYISQMFADEKEPEMQIGLPTDVKHVAHIGMDGPAANKPSWMTEFSSAPELSAVPLKNNKKPSAAGNQDSLPPLANGNEKEKPKKSRRKASIGGNGSPVSSPKGSEKQSRRHRSSNLSMESPGRDSPSHARRSQNRGIEAASPDRPDIPKKSRRKKSKESSDGSTESSSRSKGPNSMPDIIEL